MAKNWMAEGMPARPSISLQLEWRPKQMRLEKNWPAVIARLLMATTLPLYSLGLTSLKYIGTIYAAIPTPNPITSLPFIKNVMLGAIYIMIAPMVNNTSATIITILLPYLSLRGPATSDPKKAPNWAKLTIISVYSRLMSDHELGK